MRESSKGTKYVLGQTAIFERGNVASQIKGAS